jgi:hypothetical protein
MSFILVIVRHPDQDKSAGMATWMSFRANAKLESLKDVAGVFCINDTAWIFDTKRTLPEYGLVVHQAKEFHIELFSFQLDSAALRSHIVASPQSNKLEEFLDSWPVSEK